MGMRGLLGPGAPRLGAPAGERARRVYGVPSGVNNVLIINRVVASGRVTAILVNERLGF